MEFSIMEVNFNISGVTPESSNAKDLVKQVADFAADCIVLKHAFRGELLHFSIEAPLQIVYEILEILHSFDVDIIQTGAYSQKDFN